MAAADTSLLQLEGVVAKRDEPYPPPTARRWRKIRRVTTMDFPVLGFTPTCDVVPGSCWASIPTAA